MVSQKQKEMMCNDCYSFENNHSFKGLLTYLLGCIAKDVIVN